MLLFYVRHGAPTYNPDELTPLGHRQAEAVAKRLSLYGLDEIYTSTSNRAMQTAKPTCEMLGKTAQALDWCNEGHAWRDFTVVTDSGVTTWMFFVEKYIKLFCSKEMTDMGEDWPSHEVFKGTNVKEGIERIKRETYAFLSELGFTYDSQKGMYKVGKRNDSRIALFAHQGFGLCFLSAVLGIPFPKFCTRFDMSFTGVTVIEFEENCEYTFPRILTLANDSHLYREGLSTKYHNFKSFY